MRRPPAYRHVQRPFFAVLALTILALPSVTHALISDGENALDLVGQFDETSFTAPVPVYTKSGLNNGANKFGFNAPSGIVIDSPSDRLFVADTNNNRILVYNLNASDTLADRVPDFVLGQSNFYANTAATTAGGLSKPVDLSYDRTNFNLFASDSTNNRVMAFQIGFQNGANAIDLLGEYDETSFTNPVPVYTKTAANNGPNKFGFSTPRVIAYDTSNFRLFVADNANNRVLVFALNSNGTLIDHVPDNVLGQPNYYSNAAATTQNGLSGPRFAAYDSSNNRLFITDNTNNRTLVYDVTAITDGENATNVLGQPNYTIATAGTTQNGLNDPQGIAYDSGNNRLFIAQSTGNRVTVYDVAAITDGENATNLLGQTLYTSLTAVSTQAGMNAAQGAAYDSANNRLFIAQSNGNRVTTYDVTAITDGENAINVLGQPNFTASAAATTQNGMNGPSPIAFNASTNQLFVVQNSANRVTVYDVSSITDGKNALNVLGQPNFTASAAATTQNGLSGPSGIVSDTTNNQIFVGDATNNRVLVYSTSSITNGKNAVDLLGQYDETSFTNPVPVYTKSTANNGPNKFGFNTPKYIEYDSVGSRLFISDSTNNRVLVYAMNTDGTLVDHVPDNILGQPNYYTASAAIQQNGMNSPFGIAYDSSNNRLFVTDATANRILVYDTMSITDGENATNVLGQSGFTSGSSVGGQNGFNIPESTAYDSGNNRLFVVDRADNRVLVFSVTAITNGQNATNVLGQPNFAGTSAATQQNGMNAPRSAAYDSTNNRLFVAQSSASRVTVYSVASITNGQNATNVLGQQNFTAQAVSTTQNGMNSPFGIAYDSTNNRLFVAQSTPNRVTVYSVSSITNGQNATNVLGQPNFTRATAGNTMNGMNGPVGLAYDSGNMKLFVMQSTSNQIKTYYVPALTSGMNATNVLGQPNFTASATATTQNGMNAPYGLALSGSSLFVGDSGNNRVTFYSLATISNGQNATNVLGQPNYTASAAASTQNGMSSPKGVAYDFFRQRLFVSENGNNRVTFYNVASLADGQNAANVLGQQNFTANGAASTANTLSAPYGLAYDGLTNRLFIADTNNNRVLMHDLYSFPTMPNATNVLGQTDFTTVSAGTGQNGMTAPHGIVYDGTHNRLFVVDQTNNRVLVYAMNSDGTFVDRTADNVLGQPDFSGTTGATTQNGMNTPTAVAYDSVNDRLYVAQSTSANRVTIYDVSAITNGKNALNVLGQPNFTASTASSTQNGINDPRGGLVYDSANNRLFVAQVNGDRVTTYNTASLTNGMNAVNVLGQPNFTASATALTQSGMNSAYDLAYDSATNRLFVADNAWHRILVFNTASITNGMGAANVLGQGDFISGSAATSQNRINGPRGLTYDSVTNRLFVSQALIHRITVYDVASITNGENATNLLGQSAYNAGAQGSTQNTMFQPHNMGFDSTHQRLFVADSSNNRVTLFSLAVSNGQQAAIVLGQPNFTATTAAATQNGLSGPRGLTFSGTTLYLGDTGNHRVLLQSMSSLANGQNAGNLLGQYDETSFTAPVPIYTKGFAHNGPNKFGFSGATLLSIDGTNHRMFIADSTNNRVLVYALGSDNTFSDRVPDNILGQPNYYSRGAAAAQNGMSDPRGMNFDAANNRLFVAQGGNNCVTMYDVTAITNGENATNILGQPNYTASAAATTQNGMNTPRGVAYDNGNTRLFVADNQNNRVLVYGVSSIVDGQNATNVLGQADYSTATAVNTQGGMNGPQGLSYDGGRSKLFVAQNTNNRVTAYDVTAITDGESATNILGQGTYTATAASNSQNGLNDPRGLAFDSGNNRLFVANYGNNRITVYSTSSMINGQNIDNILGQPNYAGTTAATTQNGLSGPIGLAFDATNRRLFVTDSANNRLTIYDGSGTSITPIGGETTNPLKSFYFFGE